MTYYGCAVDGGTKTHAVRILSGGLTKGSFIHIAACGQSTLKATGYKWSSYPNGERCVRCDRETTSLDLEQVKVDPSEVIW